jgi:hypothetical protein
MEASDVQHGFGVDVALFVSGKGRMTRAAFCRSLLVGALASSCVDPEETKRDSAPLIVMDQAHNHAGNDEAETYAVGPGSELVLDVGQYSIPVPPALDVDGPNTVHIIHGPDEYYRTEWNGLGRVVLSHQTLESVKESAFSGFLSGETYIVGVGHERFEGPERTLAFSAMWVGMVRIQ